MHNRYLKGLTDSQKAFFNEAMGNRNVFLTGVAGTGKSYVIQKYLEYCGIRQIPVGITASTGLAALNIGGSTLHSFLGIGLGNDDVDTLTKKVLNNKYTRNRIKRIKVLLIDEVSMISGTLMDKINQILRSVRMSGKPFGGVKLIVIGDHLQLPPVSEEEDYCFSSKSWGECEFINIVLKEVVRQKDKEFSNALSKIRVGDLSGVRALKPRINATLNGPAKPVKLYSHNKDVEKENLRKLREIDSESVFFDSETEGNEYAVASLIRSCPAPEKLELRVGAQVMLLWNLDVPNGLCNGSIGVVEKIDKNPFAPHVKVRFKTGVFDIGTQTWDQKELTIKSDGTNYFRVTASKTQIPLKLAYAVTIHKSQGQTLDAVEIDLSKCFESGQAYVALSRVRDLESMTLLPFDEDRILINEKALEFYNKIDD